ncbi:MAG: hypothetical protein LUD72_08195 [Bacteroidales bacterium]|nr:hypothetical protein [Bacteroidales bacterium]
MRKRIEIPVMAKCCGRIFIAFLFFALLTACAGGGYVPRTGDLVFQMEGEGGFSGAISAATAVDTINYVHVGIVVVEEGRAYVLEAEPQKGVVMTPWEDFMDGSPLVGGGRGVTVMRLDVDFPLDEAMERAKSHLGEPYDWHFLSDNGKMYCSELVYDTYLYKDGGHIFTAVPMNFRASDGNVPEFWTELFGSFGEPVPEGVLGTNPNGLARDPLLKEVHRFH